ARRADVRRAELEARRGDGQAARAAAVAGAADPVGCDLDVVEPDAARARLIPEKQPAVRARRREVTRDLPDRHTVEPQLRLAVRTLVEIQLCAMPGTRR